MTSLERRQPSARLCLIGQALAGRVALPNLDEVEPRLAKRGSPVVASLTWLPASSLATGGGERRVAAVTDSNGDGST